jgi:hypothetical protein
MDIREKAAEVRGLIERAFSETPYPGDERVASVDHCIECREIADSFRGKHWKDLEKIEWHSGVLGLMNDGAYRFFLPGFLIGTLKPNLHNEGLSTHAGAFLQEVEWHLRFPGFTADEIAAVKAYLEFLKSYVYHDEEHAEIDAALLECSKPRAGS